jgi:O-antigen biosynthesis protein
MLATHNLSKGALPGMPKAAKAVVILGMHRSGTSALCGALHLMGVDFGNRLMPATDANAKGYSEHEEIVRAHDRLLTSLGSYWDDDEPMPPRWVEREITHEVQADLVGIFKRDFAPIHLFGIKDRRMCRLRSKTIKGELLPPEIRPMQASSVVFKVSRIVQNFH